MCCLSAWTGLIEGLREVIPKCLPSPHIEIKLILEGQKLCLVVSFLTHLPSRREMGITVTGGWAPIKGVLQNQQSNVVLVLVISFIICLRQRLM